jgi:hypothetical protein
VSTAAQLHMPILGEARRSTEVKTVEIASTSEVNSIDLAAAIGQALSRAGLNHKQACAWMEIDPGLWSRQLSGDGHISFQRLLKLPVVFWTEFVPLLAEPIGLVVGHEDIAERALMQCVFATEAAARAVVEAQRVQRLRRRTA